MKGPAANPELQTELRQTEAAEREQVSRDWKKLLELPEGQRALWRILSAFCGFMSVYPGRDSEGLQRNEGRREVGGILAGELQQASIEGYVEMIESAVRAGQRRLAVSSGTAAGETHGG